MPYIKRAGQLHNTLISYAHYYHQRNDYEVILIEDLKNVEDTPEHELLRKVISDFRDHVPIVHDILHMKDVCNPSSAFNLAARIATGDFLVITSPECLHWTNIFEGADYIYSNSPKETYLICAAELRVNCNLFIQKLEDLGGRHQMWFQHSQHRNKLIPFCGFLHRDVWNSFGGYNEEFTYGFGYDDGYLIDCITESGIPIQTRDDMMVIHIDHGDFPYRGIPRVDNRELIFKLREQRASKKV